MTNTKTRTLHKVATVLIAIALCSVALQAHADTRGSLRNGVGQLPGSVNFSPTPTIPQGGITASTNGSADSGGNTGGVVVTGDEHVEVFEVNIGPTNDPEPSLEDEEDTIPSVPSSSCDGRSRSGCTVGSAGRTR